MLDILTLATNKIIIKRNEFLNVQGCIDTNLYYINSGSLRVFVENGEQEQNIRFAYKESFIVFLDSFLSGKPSNFNIQAIKKTQIFVIKKDDFNEYISLEDNYKQWIQLLENLILQQIEREVDLLYHSPKERYLRVLRRSPKLFQEIPHKHIANYLRMSPETLSRLKNDDLNQYF